MKKRSWYPKEDGKFIIEIKVDALEQLFDKRDPNPFLRRDLDDDAAEYILTSAQEVNKYNLGKLRILTHDQLNKGVVDTVTKAIKEYFCYRSDMTSRKVKTAFKLGFKSLVIGLCFLFLTIYLSSKLLLDIENTLLKTFFKEGMLLIGWVSMWKPINVFLYDWWPLVDLRNYFEVLSKANIEIVRISERKRLHKAI